MTPPLYLLPEADLAAANAGGVLELDGAEGHHAATVARLKVGESLLIGDGNGHLAHCAVSSVDRGRVQAVIEEVTYRPPPDVTFTLVQALAKADRDLLAIEVATELGIDRVVAWQADRSVVRWRGERGAKAQRKWHNTLLSATKQARRSHVPELQVALDRSTVREYVERADLAVVLHESATEPLAALGAGDLPDQGEVVLVVGPEGGISEEELAALRQAGARVAQLGDTVLRTSTAGSAAIALLSALGRWRA